MSKKGKPIILIVDDVPQNIQVLGTLLAKFNCELAVAMNGQQALETLERIKPDLILLDVMMPIMDGYETCKRLKSNPKTKEIPVIFLSAKTETEDIVNGFKLGAVDYITKPFIGRELVARVETHLTLKRTKETLAEEVNSKNKFFSIISHDLRGAFGIIMNFVELIQNGKDFLTPADIEELLNDIAVTSKNTLELLENLLKWARTQNGAIKLEPEKVETQSLLIEIYSQHKKIAEGKEIKLEIEKKYKQFVYGDKNMLLLILRNLVSNALKFTQKDGTVYISTEEQDKYVMFTVSDTGVGIRKEVLDRLFLIDSKVSTQGTANEMGNGLGLLLCKEFVTQNGGEISIESTPGVGTKVRFTIPKN